MTTSSPARPASDAGVSFRRRDPRGIYVEHLTVEHLTVEQSDQAPPTARDDELADDPLRDVLERGDGRIGLGQEVVLHARTRTRTCVPERPWRRPADGRETSLDGS